MFVDGAFYGATAQNLAEGYGHIWQLSPTQNPIARPFFGHPPLVIWLLSVLMTCTNNAFWAERLFSIFCLLLLSWGIIRLWKITNPSSTTASSWLVGLFWLMIPINLWAYSQLMLENLLTVAVIWSIYFGIKTSLHPPKWFKYSLFSGLWLIIGTLCKGPVGLFPLVIFGSYWLVFRSISFIQVLRNSLVILSCLVGFYALLYLGSTDAAHYFSTYFGGQLKGSLSGSNNINPNRFYVLEVLLIEAIAWWVLTLLYLVLRKKMLATSPWFWFFILLGLSASLPILISPKQMKFYLIPAFACLAIAMAHLFFPVVQYWISQRKNPPAKSFYFVLHGLLLVSLLLSISRYNSYSRDSAKIQEIEKLVAIIPPHSKVIMQSQKVDYIAEFYFIRLGNILVNDHEWQADWQTERATPTPYLLIEKNYPSKFETYYLPQSKINKQLKIWNLYRPKKQ